MTDKGMHTATADEMMTLSMRFVEQHSHLTDTSLITVALCMLNMALDQTTRCRGCCLEVVIRSLVDAHNERGIGDEGHTTH